MTSMLGRLGRVRTDIIKLIGNSTMKDCVDFQLTSTIDRASAELIGKEFDTARHMPDDAFVREAYIHLREEVVEQWLRIRRAGLTIEPWLEGEDPYEVRASNMKADVEQGHLFVTLTTASHGELHHELDQSQNPLMQPTDFFLMGQQLLVNDLFRAVHDVFGHAVGVGAGSFGPVGEENAWRSHMPTFSSLARRAMTTETRGQNCWFNFGPHLQEPDVECACKNASYQTLSTKRPFAEQKCTILPLWTQSVGRQ